MLPASGLVTCPPLRDHSAGPQGRPGANGVQVSKWGVGAGGRPVNVCRERSPRTFGLPWRVCTT